MTQQAKVAIVTGDGTGMGEAVAHKFARRGGHLVLGGLEDDPVIEVAQAITAEGGEAAYCLGDLVPEEFRSAPPRELLMRHSPDGLQDQYLFNAILLKPFSSVQSSSVFDLRRSTSRLPQDMQSCD